MTPALRIATRQSPLALWQAEHVKALLEVQHPGLHIALVPMTTSGDQMQDRSLATVGGKGLFVKELEQAMLESRADLAVHSMKDVPAHLPEGLCLTAFLAGEDPRDALVTRSGGDLASLAPGAMIGTGSLRRQSQLRRLRPDLVVHELRGNVGTRLRRLDEGAFDGILLARAGLLRLGLDARVAETFDPEIFIPAIAQGVIGIECRADDRHTRDLLAPLHDVRSAVRLAAERALNENLGGACTVPVAGHAILLQDKPMTIRLTGLVAAPDGTRCVRDEISGSAVDAAQIGLRLAKRLLDGGAREILGALGVHPAEPVGIAQEPRA